MNNILRWLRSNFRSVEQFFLRSVKKILFGRLSNIWRLVEQYFEVGLGIFLGRLSNYFRAVKQFKIFYIECMFWHLNLWRVHENIIFIGEIGHPSEICIIPTVDRRYWKSYFFWKVVDQISIPLAHINNLSFESDILPNKLKISRTVPEYKAGDLENCSNYRPISCLPT